MPQCRTRVTPPSSLVSSPPPARCLGTDRVGVPHRTVLRRVRARASRYAAVPVDRDASSVAIKGVTLCPANRGTDIHRRDRGRKVASRVIT